MRSQIIYVSEKEYRAIKKLMAGKAEHEPNIKDYEKILGKGDGRLSIIASCAHHDIPMKIVVRDGEGKVGQIKE